MPPSPSGATSKPAISRSSVGSVTVRSPGVDALADRHADRLLVEGDVARQAGDLGKRVGIAPRDARPFGSRGAPVHGLPLERADGAQPDRLQMRKVDRV